jgi:hypothetical protein
MTNTEKDELKTTLYLAGRLSTAAFKVVNCTDLSELSSLILDLQGKQIDYDNNVLELLDKYLDND